MKKRRTRTTNVGGEDLPDAQLRTAFLRIEAEPIPDRLKAQFDTLAGAPRKDRRI